MAKIMLVEDDKSLREIYSIRLVAEGYEVISAGDGEEALALAVQQRPDLIVSDVMMPKISGFDMLDILRSTPETKDIKVIMMTALSSDDQRQRGESLGADKYLVKSQVGIEDVINAVHEVLGDGASTGSADAQKTGETPAPTEQPSAEPTEQPTVVPVEQPSVTPASAGQPVGEQELVGQPMTTLEQPASPTEQSMATAESAPTGSAASQPQVAEQPAQSNTAAAMEELLNDPSTGQNATWPGNAAQ